MRKNILIGGGIFAVTLATVGFIALNTDTSRYLGQVSLSDDIDL